MDDTDDLDYTDPSYGFITRLTGWATHPFNQDTDVGGWFLFTGLIIGCAILWGFILRKIQEV